MFEKIEPNLWESKIIPLLRDQWMLITAGSEKQCNTMTASWGGVGVLWGVPMATIYVRPQRYTKEFIDREEYVTLSFLPDTYRKELAFCGKESGRTVDKIKECGFTVETRGEQTSYIGEAELVLVCKKRYTQAMDPSAIPEDVKAKWYPEEDYHQMYFCEILEILKRS